MNHSHSSMATSQPPPLELAATPTSHSGKCSHVYVFVHPSGEILKIGKANSIPERATALGMNNIDLSRSFALRRASMHAALETESRLHAKMKKWAIDPLVAKRFGVAQNGVTEWFSGRCFDHLVADMILDYAWEDHIGPDELGSLVLAGRIGQLNLKVSTRTADRFHELCSDRGATYSECFERLIREALEQSERMQ